MNVVRIVNVVNRNRNKNRSGLRRERLFRDRLHPLEFYDDVEIKRLFRFERHNLCRIIDDLTPALEYPSAVLNKCLNPSLQVCVAVRFYATGSMQLTIGSWIHIDQSTVSRTCYRVTKAILSYYSKVITIPEDLMSVKRAFYNISGIPNVIGCIDGTHVKINTPSKGQFPDEYINRKGYHSINVQCVCDANCYFLDVDASWPGSVHDNRIFKNSILYERLQRRNLGMLFGDKGYGLTPFLLTPYRENGVIEDYFNKIHKRVRNCIERAFGQCKKRFYCLQNTLNISLERAGQTIVACMILHNLSKNFKDSDFDDDEHVDDLQFDENEYLHRDIQDDHLYRLGEQVRRRIAQQIISFQ